MRQSADHPPRLLAGLAGSALLGALVVAGVSAVATPAVAAPLDDCAVPDVTLTAATTGNNPITVNPGQVVALTGGTFNGGINQLPARGTLCVTPGATLAPSYLNNAQGAIAVAPGGVLNAPNLAVAAGFELDNAGTTTFLGLAVNGNAELVNREDASLTITGGFSPAAGHLDNAGTMTIQGSTNLNGQVSLSNSGELIVQGALAVDGRFDNTGVTRIAGALTVNGSAVLVNSCGIETGGDLINTARGSSNAGLLTVGGTFTNNGTWTQSATGTLTAVNLVDDRTITGFGSYAFSGSTSVQGTFRGDSAADPIVVDTGQDPPFPGQTGQIENVMAGTVTPGSVDDYPAPGCSTSADRASADVQVTKSGPGQIQSGDQLTYTITVRNEGPDAAEGVAVTDTLPADLAEVTASNGGLVTADTVTWTLGTLAVDQQVVLTVTGTVIANGGSLTNVASSTATTPDPSPANNNGSTQAQRVVTVVEAADPATPDPPTAADLTRTTEAGVPLVGLGAGTSPDGLRLTYERLTEATNGTAGMSGSGLYAYVPDPDFSGIDSFEYRVCDSQDPIQCSAPATVTITVLPRALNDEATTRTGQEVTIPVGANDTSTAQITRIVTQPSHGGVTSWDPATGDLIFNPGAYIGSTELVYETCAADFPTVCAQATVTIHVIPANDPPVATPTLLETTVGAPVTGDLEVTDPDGDDIAVGEVFEPAHGSETVQQLTTTYVPQPGFAGIDTFLYTACDDGVPTLCTTGLVRVIVNPVATDDTASTTPGTAVQIDVLANDAGEVDPPGILTEPANGSVVWNGSGFVYTPAEGFRGTDTFTYTICAADESGICSTATVTVTVAEEQTPPGEPGTGGGAGGGGTGGSDDPGSGPTVPHQNGTGSGLGGSRLAVTGATTGGVLLLGLGLLAGGVILRRSTMRHRHG
ncbi:Ig-like domain-containing protein [Cellulomonas sp. NPDC089187]|uniref:Ig-like domain-containing protein n=1 Tax=Cellulomonas sp. NPDC089187 TaxID=3154970 RepID=UPI003425D8D9